MNVDKKSEFWELESFTKYFPKQGVEKCQFWGLIVGLSPQDVGNKILDQLYGFHDFSPDSIKFPEDQSWDDEEFGDVLLEAFDFDAMKRGDVISKGNDVECSCIHEIEQVVVNDTDNSQDIEQIKFFVIAFQCDVVLVAVRGFCFEEFQNDLFVYWTSDDGEWVSYQVVNGYLGEMKGDLSSEDDDDFFDD